jgi:hypothetical protein
MALIKKNNQLQFLKGPLVLKKKISGIKFHIKES